MMHIQKVVMDKASLMSFISEAKYHLQDRLTTQTVIKVITEIWVNKVMKQVKETSDLWAKRISNLEHVFATDFDHLTQILTAKMQEFERAETDQYQYQLFIEAVIVYLKPIQEIFDAVVEEPPLYYDVKEPTQTINTKVEELTIHEEKTPPGTPVEECNIRKDNITEAQWKEVQHAWDTEAKSFQPTTYDAWSVSIDGKGETIYLPSAKEIHDNQVGNTIDSMDLCD